MEQRILVVDDDPDSVANLVDILEDLGYAADSAASGEDAMEKLRAAAATRPSYGLGLFDLCMPGIDGVELYQQAMQVHPGLRAILITANAGDEGVHRAARAGVWHVMHKPVDVRQLLEKVEEAVG